MYSIVKDKDWPIKGKTLCSIIFLVGVSLILTKITLTHYRKIIFAPLSSKISQALEDDLQNILITGGLGTVGRILSASLVRTGYHVIILDVNDNVHQLFDELNDQHANRNKVTIVNGDIRNYSIIHKIHQQHNRLHGIIHLAGVSHEDWCEQHPQDCFRLNVNATHSLLQTIKSVFTNNDEKPWLLYLSSYHAYKHQTIYDKSQYYTKSKIQTEKIIKDFSYLFSQTTILRIPHIYGSFYDYSYRIIPYFVRQVLTHNPISLTIPFPIHNYIHVHDVVNVSIELIKTITLKTLLSSNPSISTFSLRGSAIDHQSLLTIIRNITHSYSLLRTINTTHNFSSDSEDDDTDDFVSLEYEHLLTYNNIQEGLQQYINEIRRRDLSLVKDFIKKECSKTMTKQIDLNQCTMIIYTDIITQTMLTCSPGKSFRTTRDFSPHFRFISAKGKNIQGMSPYHIQCLTSSSPSNFFSVVNRTVIQSNNSKSLFFISYSSEYQSMALLTYANEQVNNLSSVQLDGSLQLWNGSQHVFFFSSYCCEQTNTLPFLSVDPLLEKQKELSWYAMRGNMNTKCHRMEAYIKQETTTTQQNLTSSKQIPDSVSTKSNILWSEPLAPDMPLCDRDCSLFTGCILLQNCRCVIDRCSTHHQYPYHKLIYSTSSQSSSQHQSRSSINDVEISQIPFEAILQPHVRDFYTYFNMPRIHVLQVPLTLRPHYNDIDRHRLQKQHCFFVDDMILRTLKHISTNISHAELVLVPFYHGFYTHYKVMSYKQQVTLIEQLETFVNTTLLTMNSTAKIVFILSHDFGGCLGFAWSNLELVHYSTDYQISSLHNAYLLQSMGDYNTNCYYPNKDIVIPQFTCLTTDLIPTFSDIQYVKHILDRQVFAFFKGTLWGSGLATRARLSCPHIWHNTWNTTNHRMTLIQKYYNNSNYLTTLNETRFCLMVAGTTGWSTRFVDAIYAGCIPVLITSSTHYPFEDILDYETFSINIPEDQLDTLEQRLLSYTDNELIVKQRYVLRVRTAFIYHNYDNSDEQLSDQNNPLFFILLSLRMRLKLRML